MHPLMVRSRHIPFEPPPSPAATAPAEAGAQPSSHVQNAMYVVSAGLVAHSIARHGLRAAARTFAGWLLPFRF